MKDSLATLELLAAYYDSYIRNSLIEKEFKTKSDLQIKLLALKEFILKEIRCESIQPIYRPDFAINELEIIDYYLNHPEDNPKLTPEHAQLLNRISDLIGFEYKPTKVATVDTSDMPTPYSDYMPSSQSAALEYLKQIQITLPGDEYFDEDLKDS